MSNWEKVMEEAVTKAIEKAKDQHSVDKEFL